jgi:hypothetical protein
MAPDTPNELYFWGWETLADSPLFTVHMDAKSSRVSVHLNRAMGPDYYAWLTFKYSDWSDFHRLVEGLDLESGAHRARTSGCASIEGPSDGAVCLTVGPLTVWIPTEDFKALREAVVAADKRIARPE